MVAEFEVLRLGGAQGCVEVEDDSGAVDRDGAHGDAREDLPANQIREGELGWADRCGFKGFGEIESDLGASAVEAGARLCISDQHRCDGIALGAVEEAKGEGSGIGATGALENAGGVVSVAFVGVVDVELLA